MVEAKCLVKGADFKILTLARRGERRPGEREKGPRRAICPSHDVRRFPQPPANPQEPATKKANRERLAFINWWWGVESNESPQGALLRVQPDRFAL